VPELPLRAGQPEHRVGVGRLTPDGTAGLCDLPLEPRPLGARHRRRVERIVEQRQRFRLLRHDTGERHRNQQSHRL
jgi:hypothetical protein